MTEEGSASPLPEEPQIVSRTLDFGDRSRAGRLVVRLPYGSSKTTLGGERVCVGAHCKAPCPCEVPVVPAAMDIDSEGRYWINDVGNGRIAVFDAEGDFEFGLEGPGNNYRNMDLQLVASRAVVLRQTEGGAAALFSIEDDHAGALRKISASGEAYAGETSFWSAQDRIFLSLYESQESGDCCFGMAEVTFEGEEPTATATGVAGLPFFDGWLIEDLEREGGNARTIAYDASSSRHAWSREVHLRLVQEQDRRKQRVSGSVSWEVEAGPDGTTHLLLFAGTFGGRGRRQDGYWYLTIEADGTVGEPVRVRAPDPSDPDAPSPTYQMRRLTLDDSGRPFVMWANSREAIIMSLAA